MGQRTIPCDRRTFLKVTGATGAVAAAGCLGEIDDGGGDGGDGSSGEHTGTRSGSTEGGSDSLTIGALVPLSGTYASLGESQQRGMEYFRQITESDGIDGRSVEFAVEDSGSSPNTANEKASKLVEQDDADVVIGISNTAAALAIASELEEQNVPFFPIAAGDPITRSECRRNMFRLVSRIGGILSNSFVQFGADQLGDNVWIHYADYAWGEAGVAGFKRAMEGTSLNIVGESSAQLGATDYSTHITDIQSSDADWVMTYLIGADVINWAKQARSNGLYQQVDEIGPGQNFKSARQALGNQLEDIYTVFTFNELNDLQASQDFTSGFVDLHDTAPSWGAAHWFTAASIYEEAVRTAGTPAADDVISQLTQVEIDSPLGPLSIRECDHQGLYPVSAGQITGEQNQYGIPTIEPIQQYDPDEMALTCAQAGCDL